MKREDVEQLLGLLLYLALIVGAWLLIVSLQRAVLPVKEALEVHNAAFESIVAEIEPESAETVSREAPEAVLDTYRVTAYCACAACCGKTDGVTKSGALAQPGLTVAADPEVLPLGTVIEFEGVGVRSVQDIGGAINGLELDLFFPDHQAALDWGVQYLKVRVVSWPD